MLCLLLACAWAATRSANTSGARNQAPRGALPPSGAQGEPAARRPQPDGKVGNARQYDIIVARNLFKPPTAPQEATVYPLPPMPPEALDFGVATEAKQGPESPWTYAGYATVNGRAVAIMENASTKRAEFVGVGDRLDKLTVIEITPTTVRLADGEESVSLALSSAFTATPLNEPPKPARAQGRGGAGGQQGRQGRGGGGGPGGLFSSQLFQQVIMPAIRDNPQYADEARQLMRGMRGGGEPPAPMTPPAP
jgi:hypothetical protein